jgi:hypothetical protein
LRFIDESVLWTVAPLGSPLIVDPVGLGVIDHDGGVTRSAIFTTTRVTTPAATNPSA